VHFKDQGDFAIVQSTDTTRRLNNALVKAVKMISVDNICGWFAHCGYAFSFIENRCAFTAQLLSGMGTAES
jgi:hypothetical protein